GLPVLAAVRVQDGDRRPRRRIVVADGADALAVGERGVGRVGEVQEHRLVGLDGRVAVDGHRHQLGGGAGRKRQGAGGGDVVDAGGGGAVGGGVVHGHRHRGGGGQAHREDRV